LDGLIGSVGSNGDCCDLRRFVGSDAVVRFQMIRSVESDGSGGSDAVFRLQVVRSDGSDS